MYINYIRWTTLSWPKRIADQIELTEEQMAADRDKFHRKLSDDQIQLEDRLDTLQMIVAGFAGRTDLSKAAEIANEVRRVMKDLKDCHGQAGLYNQRERLFERPVTQVRSSHILDTFYKSLDCIYKSTLELNVLSIFSNGGYSLKLRVFVLFLLV